MMKVIDIVGRLNQTQKEQIAVLLKKDKSYADITLKIYNAYIHSHNIKDVKKEIGLDEKSFNVFERVVYRAILQNFQIEDISVKDILSTSVFYAINGISAKKGNDRIQDLEDMFMNMKRHGIEEESAPLLAELADLSQGSQLETVYHYLYNKYLVVEAVNTLGAELFDQFNRLLGQYISTQSKQDKKALIKVYKEIRILANGEPQSKTLDCIYNLSRFSLVVIAKQPQILNDSHLDVYDLHLQCKNQVNDLAFGMKKYYLNNIFTHLSIQYFIQENKIEDALKYSDKANKIALLEANNFSFPNYVYEGVKSELIEFRLKNSMENEMSDFQNIKVVSLPNGQPFYDRSNISHLMN